MERGNSWYKRPEIQMSMALLWSIMKGSEMRASGQMAGEEDGDRIQLFLGIVLWAVCCVPLIC